MDVMRRPSALGRVAGTRGRHARLAAYGAVAGVLALLAVALSGCDALTPDQLVSAGAPSSNVAQDYATAQALSGSGHCTKAIPLYLRAVIKDSMFVNAYVNLATCYQAIGSFNAAIVQYNKAITVDPANYGLYIGRAGAEALSGNTGAAAADDAIALRLAPPQAPAYVSIANSYASYAEFAGAITAFTKAIDLVQHDPSLYEQRAKIYQQMQDYSRAYADYHRAIKVAPYAEARANVYIDLANVYNGQGDVNSAYGALATAIRMQPNDAQLYLQSGDLHLSNGALAGALTLYDRATHLATGSDAETAYEDKGNVLVKMGRAKDAIAAYRQALHLASDAGTQLRLKTAIKAARSGHIS